MARKKSIFSERTPLGERVVLTRNRWREIIRYKHPALALFSAAVRECIRNPDVIRSSVKNAETHLYYRAHDDGYVCVVVGGEPPDQRFVVTAYFTKNFKKGFDLWIK